MADNTLILERYLHMQSFGFTSSLLLSAGYEARTKTLRVVFKSNNATWEYANVTLDEWNAFAQADSQGNYFLRNIKPHKLATRIE